MATVRASLALYDGMTQPLQSIHRALNIVLNTFEAVQTASGRAIDVSAIQQAREELARAGAAFNNIEANAQRASHEQSDFNQNIRDGTTAADRLHGSFKGILAAVGSIASVRWAKNWVVENLRLSDVQRNAERQLQVVLQNVGAQEVEIPLQVNVDFQAKTEITAQTDIVTNYAEKLAALDNRVLKNRLFLDTAEATDSYNNFVAMAEDRQINLSLQTDTTPTVSAFEAIKAKAAEIQSRGMFGDEAMIAGAAELSTYFSDTEAIASMMDTLADYAAGMSLGHEVDSRQMTDYATNLGKIMGGTYTAMSQKGFQFSEAQKAIIEGTASQVQIVETLGAEYLDMSADMQAAAAINQVIAESWEGMYEAMSNTPSGKIAQLKNAFGDVREVLGDRLYPAVLQFVDAFQSHLPQVTSIMGGFASVCAVVIRVLAQAFSLAATLGGAIADNWGIIGPVVYGAATAALFYLGVTKGVALAQTVAEIATKSYQAAVNFLSIGYGVLTGNTAAASAAIMTYNAALMACPITWLIIGFIAVVAIIYTVVGAINHFVGTSISATGLICGAIAAAGAFVANLFMAGLELILGVFATLYNTVAMVANFLGNVFNDPVAAIARLFFDLVDNILSLLQTLASAIDTIFGKNLADSVQGWRDKLSGWVNDRFGAEVEVMGKFNTADFLSDYRLEYGGAFDFGYDFGKNLADKFKLPSLDELYPDLSAYELGDKLDGIYENAQNTAGNTAAMANTLDSSDEDLQYLRDLAEREAINQFTTAEIVVDMGGITNQINKLDDLDGIVTRILDGVNEAVEIAAEGVHV